MFSKLMQDEDGNTALIQACLDGHLETVKLLLDCAAVVDYQNKESTIKQLNTMLANNSWHYIQKGDSALHFSSIMGDVEVVKALLERGARVNLQDEVRCLTHTSKLCLFLPYVCRNI